MFCRQCGKKIVDGGAFCTACGTPVARRPVPRPETVSETPAEVSAAPGAAVSAVPEISPETAHPAAEQPPVESVPSAPAFFSAAGSLSAGEFADPRPAAPAPDMPSAPETGGFVDKVGISSPPPPPPVMLYGEDPYEPVPYAEPVPVHDGAHSAKETKRNLMLWIIVGVLAVGVIAAACVLLFVPSVHDAVFGAPTITITSDPVALAVGEKTDLNDRVTLDHVDGNKVGWKTSDPAVATVRDGKVQAIAPGTCEITIYAKQDETIADSVVVTVTTE